MYKLTFVNKEATVIILLSKHGTWDLFRESMITEAFRLFHFFESLPKFVRSGIMMMI